MILIMSIRLELKFDLKDFKANNNFFEKEIMDLVLDHNTSL